MKTRKPAQNPDIATKEIGEETLLYGANAEAVHILNPTAKLIWDLCDGKHTIADITQEILDTFSGIEADHANNDVQQTLTVFLEKNLIR